MPSFSGGDGSGIGEAAMGEQLLQWVIAFSYPAVFALLVATGLGAPLSEELILLTGGGVAAQGHHSVVVMICTAFFGVLTADSLLYRVGRSLGPRALQSPRLKKVLTPARVEWVQGHFRRFGGWTIFVVRFLPGLRAPTFLIAGMSSLPRRTFLLADAAAAVLYSPLLVYLGYRFGSEMLARVQAAGKYLVLGVIAIGVIATVTKLARRHRRLSSGEGDRAAGQLARDLPQL